MLLQLPLPKTNNTVCYWILTVFPSCWVTSVSAWLCLFYTRADHILSLSRSHMDSTIRLCECLASHSLWCTLLSTPTFSLSRGFCSAPLNTFPHFCAPPPFQVGKEHLLTWRHVMLVLWSKPCRGCHLLSRTRVFPLACGRLAPNAQIPQTSPPSTSHFIPWKPTGVLAIPQVCQSDFILGICSDSQSLFDICFPPRHFFPPINSMNSTDRSEPPHQCFFHAWIKRMLLACGDTAEKGGTSWHFCHFKNFPAPSTSQSYPSDIFSYSAHFATHFLSKFPSFRYWI